MAVRAVLFDFDGTLADSYAAITASVNHVRTHAGLPPLTEPEVRRLVGHGLEQLMSVVAPQLPADHACQLYRQHHPTVMNELTRLLPGVPETLHALHRRGLRLGVCSNKPALFTAPLIETLGLGQVVSVVCGPSAEIAAKPAPDMLHQAMRLLGVGPSETLYVGDMTVDVQTGRAAGVRTLVIPTGSEDLASLQAIKPDGILRSFADLLEQVG